MEWELAAHPASATYQFLVSAVAPRPIAWITTLGPGGVVNAAPFSWYNAVCGEPPMVMTAIRERSLGVPKDTLRNIRDTGEYVVNASTTAVAAPLVASSADYPPEVSEAEALGLATAPSRKVRPPRLAGSPVHLECRLDRILELGRHEKTSLVLGEVVHMSADDGVLDERGNVDPAKVTFLARMGGKTYADTSHHFPLERPKAPG